MHVYSSQAERIKQKKKEEVGNDHLLYSPTGMRDEQGRNL
jgi:hypothetical protein